MAPDFQLAMVKTTAMNPRYKPVYHATLDSGIEQERKVERRNIKSMAESAVTATLVNRISKGWIKKVRSKTHIGKEDSTSSLGSTSADALDEVSPSKTGEVSPSKTGEVSPSKTGEKASPKSPSAPEEEEEEGPPTVVGRILWVLSIPYKILYLSIPDCRKERCEKLYMGTFIMSIVWIGILSYAMLYFSSRAGCIMGIPGIVMGVVIISAGTSVPDALSSIFVARNGQGDMAVSNVLGSNVFNIFLGLGFPWFMYTVINGKPLKSPGLSKNLVPSIIILFGYLALLVVCMMVAGWRLYPKVGYVLMMLHLFFIAYALLTNPIGDGDAVFTVDLRL